MNYLTPNGALFVVDMLLPILSSYGAVLSGRDSILVKNKLINFVSPVGAKYYSVLPKKN